MGLSGNRQGPRGKYVYETDQANLFFIIETDQDLAIAGLGAGSAAPELYDPASPPAGGTICPAPRKFTPRTLFVQDPVSGARKSLTVFSITSALYNSSVQQSVTIDALPFVSTGRKGEKLTF